MKTKRNIVLLGFLFTTFAVACTKQNIRPISNICRYDGAHSGTIVKVICTGIGSSQETALVDAKKAAAGYVVSRMLQTTYQRSKFGAVANSFYARYNKFLAKVQTDGTYKLDDEGKARVEASMQVRRDQVAAYLKDNGIISSSRLRQKVGNPSLAITTRWKTKDPRWESFIRGAANTFLTERQYNAIDLESKQKELNTVAQRVLKIDKVAKDQKARAAMMLGADVYIQITCWNELKGNSVKGAARVKAYETSTSRLLGDQTAFGRSYVKNNQVEFQTVKEAIQNAIQRVLTQIDGYWKQDVLRNGNRYKLLLVGNMDKVEDMGDQLILVLKRYKGISALKCPIVTKHRMPCNFRSRLDPAELRLSLKATLRKAPGVTKLSYLLKARKFFILAVNHTPKASTSSQTTSDSDSLPPGL